MLFQSKSVSSALANLCLNAAISHGIGPQEFQRLTGISESEARQAGGRIPAAKHIAMLNLTEPLWDVPQLFGQGMETPFCAPLSMLLGIATNAPSLRAAFDDFIEFRPLLGDVDALRLQRAGADFEFDYHLDGEGRSAISAFGNLSLMARLVNQYADDARRTIVIELTGKAFASPGLLGQLAGARVSFGQPRNRMRFTTALSERPYPQHNDISYRIMRGQAGCEVRELRQKHSFALQVEEHLARQVREQRDQGLTGNPLERLCDQLSVSRWAVQRRLQKENTSFQDILSSVRLIEAKRLLAQPGVAISDISDMLGFSSPSAFSRFFSGQSGMSPSRYKGSHHAW